MTHTLDSTNKTDTIRIGSRDVEITKLNRRQILDNLDKLKDKGLTDTEIDELWFHSKKVVK